MIIKVQFHLESQNFSDPSVEKSVIEDLLRSSVRESLSIKGSNLKCNNDDLYAKTKNFRQLLLHLKELEAIPVTNERVLETMRTGIKKE